MRLMLAEFQRSNFGDVKGTITGAVRYHFVPNDVRRHRLISISYMSLLPRHGRGRGFESRRPRHSFLISSRRVHWLVDPNDYARPLMFEGEGFLKHQLQIFVSVRAAKAS